MELEASPRVISRAHVFVVRDGLILALRQTGGWRWWELPGGELERDERAIAAAVRETFEETGLRIETPELLRTWSYRHVRGDEVACHAYVAEAMPGDVVVSEEHSDFAWMGVAEYVERYCSEHAGEMAPHYADFFAGVRRNCELLREWLLGRTAET